jgi:hypothetical protein
MILTSLIIYLLRKMKTHTIKGSMIFKLTTISKKKMLLKIIRITKLSQFTMRASFKV